MNEFMVIRLGKSYFVEPLGRSDQGLRIATGSYDYCLHVAEQRAKRHARQARAGGQYEVIRVGDGFTVQKRKRG